MTFFKLYLVSLIIFCTLDLFWLGLLAKNLYREQIGFLMSKEIKWGLAILVYCLYVAGLSFFATLPAFYEGNRLSALLYGGFFGFVCYGIYNLTNLATLEGWPAKIVVYDLLWGTFVSGVTSLITFSIGYHWKPYFT